MSNRFLFRNSTIERFIGIDGCDYSGYDDISNVPQDASDYIWFYTQPIDSINSQAELIRSYISKLQIIINSIPIDKPLILITMDLLYGVFIVDSERQIKDAIDEYNAFLFSLSRQRPLTYTLDFSDFTRKYKQEELIDWKYYFLSQTCINPRLATDFKNWFHTQLNSINLSRKKCLILDLDNTLWAGVLGEDGVGGIECSGDYPGKAFHWWQQALLELQHTGVMLAICSKNNLEDVETLWQNNPNLVLKKEHFVAWRINWQDKATNIREISQELNIGLESVVFVDDNPTERELIKQTLPMVSVPNFPTQPYELPLLYKYLVDNFFSVYKITDEDKLKTAQYHSNLERQQFETSFTDLEQYIKSLEIELSILPANDFSIVRIVQMTRKTNQFNLTTHRYTEADIKLMLQEKAKIFTLAVKDRFGDNGITGLIIIKDNTIDTFLLSCRILGKGIEHAFLNYVLLLLKKDGVGTIYSSFFPTLKNQQVSDFYSKNGFELIKEEDGNKFYKIDLKEKEIQLNDKYKYI